MKELNMKAPLALSDLTIGKQLGEGSFGRVFECFLSSDTKNKLAIKFLKLTDNSSLDMLDEFYKETNFMKTLSHQYVVQFYG